METLTTVMTVALACLGGAVVVLKVVAPITRTEWDNKALKLASSLVSLLSGVVTPKVTK